MADKRVSKSTPVKLPTVRELLEAGTHFGHETKRWNPNFADFVYTKRDKFHIIDLEKTLECLKEALEFLKKKAQGGEILIVGTKRQARDVVREEAIRCGAHFIINRWVGGLVTNFDRIRKSIEELREIEKKLDGDISEYTQQELSVLRREWARLDRLFGGVKELDKLPDVVVIIDAKYERMPLRELRKAKVPVIALVDSNTDPRCIDYPVPANDDAIKSVELFVKYFAEAILAGNRGGGVKHKFKDYSMVGIKEADRKSLESAKVEEREKKKETSKSKKVVSKKKVTAKATRGRRKKAESKKK